MLTGTVAMAAIGVVLNTFVLVPLYSSFMPLTEIIKMGQAIFLQLTAHLHSACTA